jgi:hypothetical protein
MTNFRIAGVGLALMLTGFGARAAEDGPYISPTVERVRISLGAMRMKSSTDLRIDNTNGNLGTSINAENDLNLDKNNFEPKFQAMIRVSERHRLRFDYFTLDRKGFKDIEIPISFRNSNLIVGDPVDSQLSLRTLGVTYAYSFLHRQKFELAGTVGVNLIDLSARARVQLPTRRVDQQENQAGPFPTLGIDGTWVISKRFYLDGRIQYLKLHVDNLDGSLGIYELTAQYRWRANISVGIGYNQVRAKLSSTKATESGFFDFNAKGPEIFVRIGF